MISRALASLVMVTVLASSTPAAARSCDRDCLRGFVSDYLTALVKHNPTLLPLAANVRFTEDGHELKLGQGLWATVTGLGSFRQDVLDPTTDTAGALLVAEEGGQPVLLALRLKVEGRQITQIETQVTRGRADGGVYDATALTAPLPSMDYRLTPKERLSRKEALRVAEFFPAGLRAGSFVAVDAPFAPDAYRNENGVFAAGPPCTYDPTCKNMKTQPLGPGRTDLQERLIAVDEDEGLVWYRLAWKAPRGPDRLRVVFEVFKVWGGQVHAVLAFIKFAPMNSTSGWD